ncbi:PspC domain-containing protein [Streptomyces sp. NBC_01477]|uniref:PspC domain-containing protein n=1 Tax=Streptomyces sp. NBC_01477 TaxID=2976015 RepID=UPI002E328F8B|nr:PspC domain-containing protein [Streptomyces sp. NBC_01477]
MTEDPHDEPPPTGATRAPSPGEEGRGDVARPRITRGREHKVLAGVCDGAGRYFGVDPVIFRIVLAVLSLTGGIGLIIYGMGWLVIPQEGEDQSEAHRLMSGRIEGAPLTAVLMALVGCGLYASMLGNGANQAFSLILLFATAGAVYWSQQRRRAPGEAAASATAAAVADAPPAVQAPPEPGGSPSWWRDPLSKEPAYLWGPDDGPYGEPERQAWRARKKAVKAGQERSWPFSLAVLLLALTGLGVGTGVSWPHQPAGASLEIGLAAVLGVLGTAFVIASFAGRAKGGTVFFSVLTLAALVGTTALPRTGHGFGSTTWRPVSAPGVQQLYERGAGRGLLDLSGLTLDGGTVRTHLKVGAGQAEVLLPPGATVVLDYDLGVGETVLPGKVNDGVDVKTGQHRTVTLPPAPGTSPAGTIDLRVEVGVGQLKVVR